MKIASNKLIDLYRYYQNELAELYSNEELLAVFEMVCEAYLTYTKQDVKNKFEENVNQSDLLKIYDACKDLKKEIPIHYILKQAYFFDSFFSVTPAVLIPRPETEELVDIIIKTNKSKNEKDTLTILDIGTGSGCIPITLKKHLYNANVIAIDISNEALNVAKLNAEKLHQPILFVKQDILNTNTLAKDLNVEFDCIVSNPPYVLESEAKDMDNKVLDHEPHLALFVSNNDPIIFYKHIIDFCKTHLKTNGSLFFELNPLHDKDVKEYAIKSGIFKTTELLLDMSGKTRFLKAEKK